jgi:hypothetical protein
MDLRTLALQTGAVDASGNPIVISGGGANAAADLEAALLDFAISLATDLAGGVADDPSDGVDAVGSFVDRVQTDASGTAGCSSGWPEVDGDADGYADTFVGVGGGSSVCWQLVPRINTTVPQLSTTQLFRATFEVRADGASVLSTRTVYFIVPPAL